MRETNFVNASIPSFLVWDHSQSPPATYYEQGKILVSLHPNATQNSCLRERAFWLLCIWKTTEKRADHGLAFFRLGLKKEVSATSRPVVVTFLFPLWPLVSCQMSIITTAPWCSKIGIKWEMWKSSATEGNKAQYLVGTRNWAKALQPSFTAIRESRHLFPIFTWINQSPGRWGNSLKIT